MIGLVTLIVEGTLVVILLVLSMVVSSCANILKELYVALILVFFYGVLNKRLISDYGFCMMGADCNNDSTLLESV